MKMVMVAAGGKQGAVSGRWRPARWLVNNKHDIYKAKLTRNQGQEQNNTNTGKYSPQTFPLLHTFISISFDWQSLIMSPMQWPLPMVGRTLKLCWVHYVIRHWKIKKFEVFSIHKLQSMTMRQCLLGAVWEVAVWTQWPPRLLCHQHTVARSLDSTVSVSVSGWSRNYDAK